MGTLRRFPVSPCPSLRGAPFTVYHLPFLSPSPVTPDLSTLVLATRNPGKLRELEARLAGTGIGLMPAPEAAPPVDEDADTLDGNARKKARALHAFTGLPALADDTGLEVDALGGRPGVRSARYAGEAATDADNRRRLLDDLRAVPAAARTARFRTVLALVTEAGVWTFEGVCEGRVLDEERGTGGFGYDALFVPAGFDETFAQMTAEAKNRISHRGRALDAFVRALGPAAAQP